MRLRREHKRRVHAGVGGRWLSRGGLRGATGIAGSAGIRTRGNAVVDPYRCCLGFIRAAQECGATLKMQETSFFLGRQTLIPSKRPGMAIWREHLFAWMVRNAESAMEFFKLPANRVVALGSQVEI